MSNDTRAQFERHFAMPEWMKKRDAMGEYLDEFAQLRWEGWQAAMVRLEKLMAAFHTNMLRAFPDKTHEEIHAEIMRITDSR